MSVQVSPLRQRMIEDMTIRNMTPGTQNAYIRAVKNFSLFFERSPDKLTFDDVRKYHLHLASRKLEAQTINQIMCALRFLYGTTLGKANVAEHIPLARRSDPLPAILSRDEVASFLKAVPSLKYRTAFATIYAAGLRVSEAVALTIKRYLAPVVGRVEPYLKMLLPGANIVLDEDLRIAAIQRDGQREDFDVLSGGTKEQLAVLTRLAFAELLLGQGRPATVILDDALAFSDDDRIESMFDVLMRAGDKVQIIVLTCRKRLFTRLGAAPLEIRETA